MEWLCEWQSDFCLVIEGEEEWNLLGFYLRHLRLNVLTAGIDKKRKIAWEDEFTHFSLLTVGR